MKRILLTAALLVLAGTASALPNLTWHQIPTWSYPMVPTHSAGDYPFVWLPDVLHGETAPTYLYSSVTNDGDADFSTLVKLQHFVDGAYAAFYDIWFLEPGGFRFSQDGGPYDVRGGRHCLSMLVDALDQLPESDETDNGWARQYVWAPVELAHGQTVVRAEPPGLTAGWDDLAAPAPAFNCDGLGISSALPWNAVVLHAADPGADYDLQLYAIPAIRDESFATPAASSFNLAGSLDVVLVNRNQAGDVAWDVGVERYSGQGDAVVSLADSWYINTGDTVADAFAADEYFKIRQLTVGPGDTGLRLISADTEPGRAHELVVYDAGFTFGGLYQAAAHAFAHDDGTLRLMHDFAAPGDYAVAVFRHPGDGSAPVDFTWRVSVETPDLAVTTLPGWSAPVTPRDTDDATASWAPLPAAPLGDPVWMNNALANPGGSAVLGAQALGTVDGVFASGSYGFFLSFLDPVIAGGVALALNHNSQSVPGGRHTLGYVLDPDDLIHEVDEGNNVWGAQFVWEPPTLAYGFTTAGTSPAGMWDGLETYTGAGPFHANCNGYRLPPSPAWWRVAAVTHAPAADFDLGLFLPATDAETGFEAPLAIAGGDGELMDYILVNDNVGPDEPLDLGVYPFIGGSGDYLVQSAYSTIVSDPLAAPIGPSDLLTDELVEVWDVWLEPDLYSFQLDNLAGSVDWSMTLHPHDLRYQSRWDILGSATAWNNGPGVGEQFQAEVTQAGWYGLVVCRSANRETRGPGTYRIRVFGGGTPVEPAPSIAVLRLDASPNPFNPATRIAFELPAAADVILDVYDVQGTRVRTLAAGRRDPGRHELAWDGRDAAGQALPSGTYMARLRAGDARVLRKLTLLK